MLAATAMLLTGCASRAVFGTETQRVWCRALYGVELDASTRDTPETQEKIADMGDVVDTLCAGWQELRPGRRGAIFTAGTAGARTRQSTLTARA